METKTYKAESMLEALQMVQEELGPDAIVLSAREAAGGGWGQTKRPGVEVVAMIGNTPAAKSLNGFLDKLQAARSSGGMATPPREAAPQIEWVTGPEPRRAQIPVYPPAPKTGSAGQAANLKADTPWQPPRVDSTQNAVPEKNELRPAATLTVSQASASQAAALPLSMQRVRQKLLDQGLDEVLVDRIFKVAREMFSSGALSDEDVCRKYVAKLLEADLKEQGPNTFAGMRRVICLVGAGGSGKTTTAAKLALFYSQKLGRKVVWICADTLRTGAIAEARAYTDALGLPLRLAYTAADLRAAIDEAAEADLVLVDTPGYNPFQEDQMVELGRLLSEMRGEGLRPACSVYLTAPANVKESDLIRSAAALGIFGLDGLILTRLDETCSYGSVYNFARKAQLPLGYFTAGRGADGMLQAAAASRLVASLFGKGWVK